MKYLLKISVSVLLLAFIFRSMDVRTALDAIAGARPGWLWLALIFQVASLTLASFRWYLIMGRLGSREPWPFYLVSMFKGAFFNQGLPTSVGGDAVRILDLRDRSCSMLHAVSGVFIDRIAGLAGLLILNVLALLANPDMLPTRIQLPLLTLVLAMLGGLVLLLHVRRLHFLRGFRLLDMLYRFSEQYHQVYSSAWPILVQLGLSVIVHFGSMVAFYAVGSGVGLELPLTVYLVLVPPVVLLTLVPISLAGWGVREGAMIGLFLLVGAPMDLVLSFSLLYGCLLIVSALPGLVAFLARRGGPRAETA